MTCLRLLGLVSLIHLTGACAPVTPSEAEQKSAARSLYTAAPSNEGEEKPAPRLSDLHGFHFVVAQGGPFVVLDDAADLDVVPGAPVPLPIADDDDVVAALSPITGGEGAPGPVAEDEREQVLYDANGVACFGELGEPALLYRGYRDPEQPDAVSRLLDEVTTSSTAPLLVAKLSVQGGDCSGAQWARPSRLAPPRLYAPVGEAVAPDEASWATALTRATRDLPEYAVIQADYDSFKSGIAPDGGSGALAARWEESDDASRVAQRFVDEDGGDAITTVELDVAGGCGSFSGSLWTAARARSRAPVAQYLTYGELGSVPLDVDDDGTLELFDGHTLVVFTGEGPQRFALPDAYFVCPC